ncbi:MAG TPA: DNA polymerase Y family protein [Rhizomicrobium sp.]
MDFLEADAITNTRRILSVWLPRLPTDRLERKKPRGAPLSEKPTVIAAKIGNALAVYALDRRASKIGLHKGQPLANARAIVPDLDVVEAEPAADAKLLEDIADWCDRFTPFVALDPPDGLCLDVTGATHLFGGEAATAGIIETSFRKQGFAVCVGMAGTAAAAWALSHYAPRTIAIPGTEAQVLAPLPIDALNCAHEVRHALRRAGLKTIEQVAQRKRAELTARFGKEFAYALERALGKSEKPISPRRPMPDFMTEQKFAEPVTLQDAIAATLNSLAVTLSSVLEERGLGARMLEAFFFRADGEVYRISVQAGAPTRDPAIIERLFRTKLDSLADPLDPGFGFDLIRLEATLAEQHSQESVAFGEDAQAKREIDQLIDRLSTRFGAHRVLRFEAQDTHIPEFASVTVPAQSRERTGVAWKRRAGPSDAPRRPLRLFSQPEPISVVAEIPDGPPLRFRWRQILHTAIHTAGPETVAMEWWRHQGTMPTRDYFRVEDEEGRRFWLFREGGYGTDHSPPRWFVHGIFA